MIVRWAFLLFAFTIPFETINLEALQGASTLSRLAGLLFFSTCFLYPKSCFHRPPQAWWWFVGYASISALRIFFLPEQLVGQFITGFQTVVQLLVLCWIGSTLLQEEKFARHTLLAFSIATLLVVTGLGADNGGMAAVDDPLRRGSTIDSEYESKNAVDAAELAHRSSVRMLMVFGHVLSKINMEGLVHQGG